jgi:hypothetical protein
VRVELRRAGTRRRVRVRRYAGRRGLNTFAVSLRGLRRGRYRARIVAVDAAGNRSALRSVTLVLRR